MDREVPELRGIFAAGRDDDGGGSYFAYVRAELMELLRHGDDGGGSSAACPAEAKPYPELPPPPPPPPPKPPTAKSTASSSDHKLITPSAPAGEAEMASWLRQVFDHPDEPSAAAAAAGGASRDEEDSLLPAANGDAGNNAERRRSSGRRPGGGGGRRSCSGRAAEQRRRDKINDKMRTLQKLVPTCSEQTDKSSTLEEVIQYVKFLQRQLQALSGGGYANVPTAIFPPPQPPCMQPGVAGDVFPAGQPAVLTMLIPPYYPFVSPPLAAVYAACAHRSNEGGVPPAPSSSSSRQLVHHSRLVPSVDLAVPVSTSSHEKADAGNRRN